MTNEIPTKQGKSKVGYKRPPKEHRFKPGNNANPNGPPKARTQLYRYVCQYLAMTPKQIKSIDETTLTLAQRGAYTTATKIAAGDWARVKEVIERDEGKVAQAVELSGGVDPVKYYQGVDPEKV